MKQTQWIAIVKDGDLAGAKQYPVTMAGATVRVHGRPIVNSRYCEAHAPIETRYEHPDKKQQQRIDFYGADAAEIGSDPLRAIWKLNCNRAKALDAEILQTARYITWQGERVATWQEKDLLPLQGTDEGFFCVRVVF